MSKNTIAALTTITIALYTSSNVSSFTIIQPRPLGPSGTSSQRKVSPPRATIFEWNDDDNLYTSSFDDPSPPYDVFPETNTFNDITCSDSIQQTIFSSITNNLSQNIHNSNLTASLARLAAAFSPSHQSVKVEDINQIHIIKVTKNHIELSAVVCDEVQCITLLIPVSFLNDCTCCDGHSHDYGDINHHECDQNSGEETVKECVLGNINALDLQAQRLLSDKHALEQFEANEMEDTIITALHNTSDLQYPSWWKVPITMQMTEECNQMKRILNQDSFQIQIKALARKGLELSDDGALFEVHKAVVSAVGPMGFFFRVIATKKDGSCVSFSGEPQFVVLDVPYALCPYYGTEPSDFRAAVLQEIASIEK